jgi:apolipoprotein N-acyltransferase
VPRLRLRARPPLSLSLLLSLGSGLALSLAFPPAGWWPLAFVCLIPLLWLLDGQGPGRGFLLGLAFGLGAYGATIYWIWRFGSAAWVALTLEMALFAGAFGLLAPFVRRAGRPVLNAVSWAALWTVFEWVRALWPFGGFTWGTVGISQVTNQATVRLATVAGVWGVSFAVVLVNGLLLAAIQADGPSRTRRSVPIGVAIAVIVVPVMIPFGSPQGAPVDVATIQVDVRDAASANATSEDLGVAALNVREHERLTGDPPDLAIWGEGALDPAATGDEATVRAVRRAVALVGAPTLIGAVTDDPDGRQRTNVLLLDRQGALIGRYDKVHLVPFGEYVPFRDELSWMKALEQIPVDRAPGERVHTLSAPGVPAFGTPICFENSFPAISRSFVREGAGFLVVTINNASYGFTAASAQAEQMSQMRAVETGRWVVDAAVSGISGFVDPTGRVTAQEGLFRTGILRGTIRSSDERTWYVRLGDWLPWLALAFLAVVVAVPRRRRTVRPAPSPLPSGLRTLVILPTFDEAATIERVLDGVRGTGGDIHAIVVDDASPDGTGDLARKRAETDPAIRVISRSQKSGLAGAYLLGFEVGLREGFDLIVEMDSDLSHDPAELGPLLHAAATAHDLVIGSRYIPGGAVTNWSRLRVGLSRTGNAYARFMLGVRVKDATSGYRVYRRELLEALTMAPFASDGYGFQIELVMRAWNLGFDIGEVPITFREREHGQSKISRRIVVEALWLVTKWGVRLRLHPSGRLQEDQ